MNRSFPVKIPPSLLGMRLGDDSIRLPAIIFVGFDKSLWTWVGSESRRCQKIVASSGAAAISFVEKYAELDEREKEWLLMILGKPRQSKMYVSDQEKIEDHFDSIAMRRQRMRQAKSQENQSGINQQPTEKEV